MADLFFPQMSSGAVAQYPFERKQVVRTIKNQLPDGSVIMLPDPSGSILEWTLHYSNLSKVDIGALQKHFSNTSGLLKAFTFIDPADNMLVSSAVLTGSSWQVATGLHIAGGMPDPFGGIAAFTLTNTGQTPAALLQKLAVPANFQYVLSLYAACSTPSSLELVRMGSQQSQSTWASLQPTWSRLISPGKLSDPNVGLTVGVSLQPGQSISIYGIQLEAQAAPSSYKPTTRTGGVYPNVHWGAGEFAVTAGGVDQFSTSFTLESAVWG